MKNVSSEMSRHARWGHAAFGGVVALTALTSLMGLAPAPGGDYPPPPPPSDDCETYPPVTDCKIIVDKELFITDLCVVNDPCRTLWDAGSCADPGSLGVWSFGHLMAGLAGFSTLTPANEAQVSAFTLNMLRQIEFNTFVDYTTGSIPGTMVNGRPFTTAWIDAWAEASGSDYDPKNPGKTSLDMHIAPFRLCAIVNRIDLRTVNGGYSLGNAGEGRFVFAFLQPDKNSKITDWQELRGTIIFEYKMIAKECEQIIQWGKAWHDLGGIPFGEPYNASLQKITDAFSGAGVDPSAPNGSGINQVRTNEIIFGDPWELREFHLTGPMIGGIVQLKQEPPALSVLQPLNDGPVLDDYVIANDPLILAQAHLVPHTWVLPPEFAFAAGASPVTDQWEVPSYDHCSDQRHLFALNNCNGCHFHETTTGFTHVDPRPFNAESTVSRFLQGAGPFPFGGPHTVAFPCEFSPATVFRDFWDFDRRAQDLCDLLTVGCGPDKKGFIIVADKEAQEGKPMLKELEVDAVFATPNVAKTVH
jgi:hypothetical protein